MKSKTLIDPPLLHYVLFQRKVDMFHYLLVSNFDKNVRCSDWTPLHLATYLGLKEFVDMLIFFGASLNEEDNYGIYLIFF